MYFCNFHTHAFSDSLLEYVFEDLERHHSRIPVKALQSAFMTIDKERQLLSQGEPKSIIQ